jgi:hypothetical protein
MKQKPVKQETKIQFKVLLKIKKHQKITKNPIN